MRSLNTRSDEVARDGSLLSSMAEISLAQSDRADETAVPRRVAGASGAEHAASDPDDLGRIDVSLRTGLSAGAVLGHLSKPLSSMVGVTERAAFSASRIASSR